MKRVKTAALALCMIAAVGLVGVAPQAEALTNAPPSVCLGYSGGGTDSIAFIVGEDGRVWYTKATTAAAFAGLGTGVGLPGNPFATAVPNDATSPLSGFVNPATFPIGTGNFGIWVPVPGGVTFQQTTPTCVNRSHIVDGEGSVVARAAGLADNVMILVAGLDKRVWHTVFAGSGGGFNLAGVLTSGAGPLGIGINVWFTAIDVHPEPAGLDGWANAIAASASPVIPWVPLP